MDLESKAKMLTEKEGRVTFDDVAGIDEAKEELEEIVEFLRNPQKFSRLGGQIPKGALLEGPPGTGKTTTLVTCIRHVLQTEKQVLVCAPSNSAVDLIVEKLHQKQVPVTRLGHPARVTEEIEKHTLDAQITQNPLFKELKKIRDICNNFKIKSMQSSTHSNNFFYSSSLLYRYNNLIVRRLTGKLLITRVCTGEEI